MTSVFLTIEGFINFDWARLSPLFINKKPSATNAVSAMRMVLRRLEIMF